jgi:hypothetical protein
MEDKFGGEGHDTVVAYAGLGQSADLTPNRRLRKGFSPGLMTFYGTHKPNHLHINTV